MALKVTSTSPLDTLLKRLENLSGVAGITHSLQEIRNLLHHIDKSPVGSSIAMYDEIIAYIKTIGVAYEAPYLFQTDLYKPVVEASVSQTIIQKLLEGLHFLNKITHKPQESNLSKFREAFYARYEEQEMPLMEVLDKESGIGYPAGQNDGDLSPLINDLFLPGTPSNPTITLDAWTKTLLQKYVAAMQEKQSCIQLSDQDVENEKADWSDLPATFSCMCTLINEQEIYIHSAGGNATNLQGRFCHLHSDIEAHVKEITAKEQAMNPEAVYAEIVHLPESRIGNILFRPVLRDYEIPYLCKPGVNKGQVIPLHDLSISIRNGRIVLRSRAFNREIIPRLSSAHNYQNHSMPVYRFLCDMQYPAGRSGVFFSWGNLTNLFDYLPRVVYKNCILSPARWLIKKKDMEEWTKLSGTTLLNAITTYRENRRIPDKVVIPDNDNELFINFTDLLSIQTLLNIGKKRTNVVIEEFLFDEKQTFVKDEKGDVFCNEFIFSFYTTTDENKS